MSELTSVIRSTNEHCLQTKEELLCLASWSFVYLIHFRHEPVLETYVPLHN